MKLLKFLVAALALTFFLACMFVFYEAVSLALTMTGMFDIFERLWGFDYLKLTAWLLLVALLLVVAFFDRFSRWIWFRD